METPVTSAVHPHEVVAPSNEVAEATLAFTDDLARTRDRNGRAAMQVQAMAMHNAALAVLGAELGLGSVRQVLEIALGENGRLAERDVGLKVPRRPSIKAKATP